jgi:hypothetical protein
MSSPFRLVRLLSGCLLKETCRDTAVINVNFVTDVANELQKW